ncbi:MAG: AsmA family protein [Alphaproteobacteria bacterium]|nr:AsmA family protein [Alphaproteobacteria bacterium]
MKLVYGAVGLVGLLVVLAFIAPFLIDWNWLKPTIATEAEESLGRQLAIDGEIEVRFLPTPRISVSDARLANMPGASAADMARAKRLDLELALGALIGGRIEVTNIVLIDPVIELERSASGEANWRFVPKPKPPTEPSTAESTPAPSEGEAVLGTGGLQTFELVNGSLTFRDAASGQVEHLHSVEASVVAREAGGPYQARGRFKLREAPLSFDGVLGRGPVDGTAPLSFVLRLEDRDATASFTGTLDRPTSRLSGTLDAKGASLSAVLDRFALTLPAERTALDEPFALTSVVGGAPDRIDLKDLDLIFGDTTASGALSYVDSSPPQLDVLLTLNRLDLDRYLDVPAAPDAKGGATARNAASEAMAPASDVVAPASSSSSQPAPEGKPVLPVDLVASVNLTIDAVRYRDAVIRSVQSILSLDKGTVTIQQASAELPGGGDASLVGQIKASKKSPMFEGTLDLRADDLRTLAAWLGVDLAAVSADRLRRFSMKAKVKADDRSVLVPRLDAKLDTSTLTGSVSIEQAKASRPGAKAQITANLSLDRLTLDAYLAKTKPRVTAAATAGEGATDQAVPLAETPNDSVPAQPRSTWLDDYDVAGSVHIARLDYRDLALTEVEGNPLWRDGVLTIGELNVADLAGMAVKASLTGKALDSDAPKFDAKLNLNAASLGALGRALGLEPGLRLASLGRTSATVTLKGGYAALAIDGTLVSEGGTLALRGDVTELGETPRVALDVTLDNATDETVRALLGARPSAPTDVPAPLALTGHLQGDDRALTLDASRLSLGPTEVAGQIALNLGGPRPYVRATLKSDHLVAPSVEVERPESITPAAGRPQDALEERTVRRAERSASKRKTAPARWSREPFDLSVLGDFDGDLSLEAARLSLGKWLAESATVTASLKDGTLDLTRFDARLFDGALAGQAKVIALARPVFAVEFTLTDADIDQLLRAVGEANAATGRVTLSGQLDAEGGSEHAIVSSLDGPIEVHGRDGTLEGIDLGAIRSTLTSLDGISSLTDLSGLAQVNLSQGSTPIHTLDGTVQFAGGVARTDNLRAVSDSGTCLIIGAANLPRWHVDGTATCDLGDSASAPVGVRLVGPIDKPARQYQIDQLMAVVGKRLAAQALDNEGLKLKLRKGAKAEPGSVADQVLRNVFGDPDAAADDTTVGDDRPAPLPDYEEEWPEPEPSEPSAEPDAVLDLLKRVVPDLVSPQ